MSAWKDILASMEEKIEAETGLSWEALEKLYEDTGYGVPEIYERLQRAQ